MDDVLYIWTIAKKVGNNTRYLCDVQKSACFWSVSKTRAIPYFTQLGVDKFINENLKNRKDIFIVCRAATQYEEYYEF